MSQIKHGAILSYVNIGIYILTGFLYTPWMIRCIGQADYGLYTLAMSVISLLAFDFGLGNATSKFICEYLAEGRQDKVDNLLGVIYKLYLGIDVLILLIFTGIYIFLPEIYHGLSDPEISKFKILFIIAASYCLFSFPFIPQTGILTGYEHFVALKGSEVFNRIFVVATMAVCLLCGYGLFALVIVNSLGGILTILLRLYYIRKDTPLKINFSFWEKDEFKKIVRFITWVTVVALAERMILNIAPSILGVYENSTMIAILGIAIIIESYFFLFGSSVGGGLFLPKVSRMLQADDVESVLELMTRLGRLLLFVCGFIFIWFIFFGQQFISLWVGDNYELVYPVAILLLIPNMIYLPQEIGMTYIVATNTVKYQAFAYLGVAAVNLAISFPLTYYFGLLGLASALFISLMLKSAFLNVVFYRKLKLNVFKFFRDCFGKVLPSLIIASVIFFLIGVLPLEQWYWYVAKNLIAVVAYCVIIWKVGANSYEKSLLKSLIPARFR